MSKKLYSITQVIVGIGARNSQIMGWNIWVKAFRVLRFCNISLSSFPSPITGILVAQLQMPHWAIWEKAFKASSLYNISLSIFVCSKFSRIMQIIVWIVARNSQMLDWTIWNKVFRTFLLCNVFHYVCMGKGTEPDDFSHCLNSSEIITDNGLEYLSQGLQSLFSLQHLSLNFCKSGSFRNYPSHSWIGALKSQIEGWILWVMAFKASILWNLSISTLMSK